MSFELLAADSNNKHPAVFERDPFTKLYEVKDYYNNIEVGTFKGSCGIPYDYNRDEDTIHQLDIFYNQTPVAKNYIYFSLSQYFPNDELKELKFYKTKNFNLKPTYILNKEGLKENGKLICKWRFPYSEDILFKNFLPDCLGHKHDFLAATSEKVSATDHKYCMVLNIYDYENLDGVYYYKTQIGKEPFYLDTTDMPSLKNGEKFYTAEKRAKLIYENKVQTDFLKAELLIKIRKSEGYKKLSECYISKNRECTLSYVNLDFLKEIGDAGKKRICESVPDCLIKRKDQLGDEAIMMIGSFIMAVDNLSTSSFVLEDKKSDSDFTVNFVPFGNYEIKEEYGDISTIKIHIKDNEFKFIGFQDGLGC